MPSRWPLLFCLPSALALAATDPYAPPDFTPLAVRTTARPRVQMASRQKSPPPAQPTEPEKPVEAVKSPEPARSVEPASSGPEGIVQDLTLGNERFVSGKPRARDLVSERQGAAPGAKPGAIILGCSDSRVPPELVFDQGVGSLFVVRSFGTVADSASLASLEYAAEHLEAQVLVVLGHEKCTAISAAASGVKMASPHLAALVEEISPGLAPLRSKYAGAEFVHHGVEANVKATAYEVIERSPILRKRVEAGSLRVVRAVYDVDSGLVRWLE